MFGDAVPSGKLTIKFPRTVGQVPIYYVFLSTGRPASESDFFFFKQKTAYEMELRLEFRRVLFRSDSGGHFASFQARYHALHFLVNDGFSVLGRFSAPFQIGLDHLLQVVDVVEEDIVQ